MTRSRAAAAAFGGAVLALVVALGAVQIASMSAYGDLAVRPSLPALLFATNPRRLRPFIGGALARAAADVHDGDLREAETILRTLPDEPRSDDLRAVAYARGTEWATPLRWYLRAGDVVRAQAIVEHLVARRRSREALTAQLALVRSIENGGIPTDAHADAWLRLGQLERQIGDTTANPADERDALSAFERAVRLAPNRKSYLLAAGIQALKLGDYDRADRYLTHAAEVGPTNANTFGVLALTHAAQGDCTRARSDLDQWRARSTPNLRTPWEDPQLGGPLRACIGRSRARTTSVLPVARELPRRQDEAAQLAATAVPSGLRAATPIRTPLAARIRKPTEPSSRMETAASSVRTPLPAPTRTPSPSPSRAPAPPSSGGPLPAPSLPVASATAVPSPLAAPASPSLRIISVSLSPTTVSSFTQVTGSVKTTDDAVTVLMSVPKLRPLRIPRLSPGNFGMTGRLPWMPFWIHGNYVVTFTAYDLRGHQASMSTPIVVPWHL